MDITSFEPINQKLISQRMKYRVYKTLGTSVVYSPMSPPSLLIVPKAQMNVLVPKIPAAT